MELTERQECATLPLHAEPRHSSRAIKPLSAGTSTLLTWIYENRARPRPRPAPARRRTPMPLPRR
ncbi:hypothetical protein ACFVJH_30755 [Streptomyces decoyicus]|uniref:hypothetical protein n=1 Tax=Streptomyces decoyicus TaxID=249567 RepID=UPI00363E0483